MMSAPASRYWSWIWRITSARVNESRSLLPFRSRADRTNRSPRKSASESLQPWMVVPIAPSSIRMRRSRRALSSSLLSGRMTIASRRASAHVAGRFDHLRQRGLGLGPAAGLQSAIRIHPQALERNHARGFFEQLQHFPGVRHPRRVDVVHARADLVRVTELAETF